MKTTILLTLCSLSATSCNLPCEDEDTTNKYDLVAENDTLKIN
ncbi:hypothetical protein SAMN05421664_3599 [Chryseobacterium soldanellicola]|uniref:Uncharacterized protein n=1 Tax=Chryseobacterium soldanellicola TaxID=311333 RepID=A0A1H1GCX8_9FLAO|nr:hypothetical protein [Chryseobacterium soldanellicola]SDR11060.1 hypothetical protein SAMN05421664_3599 [Chryseobacterium soldanellicola]